MEKVSLPIKTKIAAWWMIEIAGLSIIFSIVSFLLPLILPPPSAPAAGTLLFALSTIFGVCFVVSFLLFFISGFFLLKRKRWAWWLSVIVSTVLIVPFILLLLDRKNFWKIAT